MTARLPNGRFPPRVSGNPNGRPPALRVDAADSTAIVRAAPKSVLRADGYVNAYTGHGTSRDRRSYTRFKGDIVSDVEALDLWETEFIAARIIEAMPEAGYSRGWKLKTKEEELAEAMWEWADELGVESAIVDAWEKENALGGSAIFPVIDGAQGDLSQPLDWGSISTIKALHVLEPAELTPVAFYEGLDERSWQMPSVYMFTPLQSGFGSTRGMQYIHASRLVVFPGLRVSRRNRPGQRLGWGISRLSRPRQVLADFGLAWGSAATLLHEHGLGVLAMDDFANLMATAEGEDLVHKRVATMMMLKSTLRALVVDGKDKYQKEASSLAGLADVLNEFKVLMSAASDGMPVSVLMGQSQSGLRTGDDDTLTWFGNVEKRRSKRIRPRHQHLMKFLWNAGDGPAHGDEPESWSVEYPSLWSPTEKEKADTRKTDMDRAVAAVEAGIVSADDVAESFYGTDTEYTGDIHVNWPRRNAQALLQSGEGDLSGEDMAAMGAEGEQTEGLSEDELAELQALQEEFGGGEDAGDDEDDTEDEDLDEDEDDEGDREDAEDDDLTDDELEALADLDDEEPPPWE